MELKKFINKDHVMFVILVFSQSITSEAIYSYDFLSSQSPCSTTKDCPSNKNLICLHVYEGCQQGHCACQPHNSTLHTSGHCVPLLRAGDLCGEGLGECRSPMTCEGACRCPRGFFSSNDKKHCLEHGTRLVGERCFHSDGRRHKCFRQTPTGFTKNDVKCSPFTSTCVCNEGFKTQGHQCLTRRLNERGCRTSIHCEGGAVCSGNKCVCPTGYHPDINFYKCLKSEAEKNVELRGSCDEVNEKTYCAPGLVCYRCAGEQQDKCIRFLLTSRYGISRAETQVPALFIIIYCAFLLTSY